MFKFKAYQLIYSNGDKGVTCLKYEEVMGHAIMLDGDIKEVQIGLMEYFLFKILS